MMLHRCYGFFLASGLVATSLVSFDPPAADAQGLLRRIRSRIEAEIAAPSPQGQAAAPTTAESNPRAGDASRPPAQRIGPLGSSDRSQPGQRPLIDLGERLLGSSILAPPTERQPEAARRGDVSRPTLGIDVFPADEPVPGARVVGIRPESLADEAGLRVDDIIIAVDAIETPTVADVAAQLKNKPVGQRIRARVIRGETTHNFMIPLVNAGAPVADPAARVPPVPQPISAAKPDATADPDRPPFDPNTLAKLGLQVEDARGARGVSVTSVADSSVAASAGLRKGDRIVAIDGRLVADSRSFQDQIGHSGQDQPVTLRVDREGTLVTADVDWQVTDTKSVATANESNGALSGIGSVLGGLFGGTQNKDAGKGSAADSGQPAVTVDPAPSALERAEAVIGGIQRAGFTDDPPSLDALPLPADASRIDAADSRSDAAVVDQLRDEIRLLKERIRALEEKGRQDP